MILVGHVYGVIKFVFSAQKSDIGFLRTPLLRTNPISDFCADKYFRLYTEKL